MFNGVMWLESTQTWTLVPPPPGNPLLDVLYYQSGSQWLYIMPNEFLGLYSLHKSSTLVKYDVLIGQSLSSTLHNGFILLGNLVYCSNMAVKTENFLKLARIS